MLTNLKCLNVEINIIGMSGLICFSQKYRLSATAVLLSSSKHLKSTKRIHGSIKSRHKDFDERINQILIIESKLYFV